MRFGVPLAQQNFTKELTLNNSDPRLVLNQDLNYQFRILVKFNGTKRILFWSK